MHPLNTSSPHQADLPSLGAYPQQPAPRQRKQHMAASDQERREYKRHQEFYGVVVLALNHPAELRDLSAAGCSFTCPTGVITCKMVLRAYVILLDRDLYLPDVLLEVVGEKGGQAQFLSASASVRHYRARIVNMTSEEMNKLDRILEKRALSSRRYG